jgi:hypothetical protein
MSATPPGSQQSNVVIMGPEILDRMERAVAKVRERLLRAAGALNQAGVAYAVVGGNAVASFSNSADNARRSSSLTRLSL